MNSIDLTAYPPPDSFSMSGYGLPQFDGVSTFLPIVDKFTEVRFNVSKSAYVRISHQLYSEDSDVNSSIFVDGKPLGDFSFPRSNFKIFTPGIFLEPGNHTIKTVSRCVDTCEIRQYNPKLSFFTIPPASSRVSFNFLRLELNHPNALVKLAGTPIQHDGFNYYQEITNSDPIEIKLDKDAALISLYGFTSSPSSNYTLNILKGEKVVNQTSSTHSKNDYPLIWKPFAISVTRGDHAIMSIQANCKNGDECYPIRIYSASAVINTKAEAKDMLFAPAAAVVFLLFIGYFLFSSHSSK